MEIDAVEVLDFKAVDHQQGSSAAVDGTGPTGCNTFEKVGADRLDIVVESAEIEPGLIARKAVVNPSAAAAGSGQGQAEHEQRKEGGRSFHRGRGGLSVYQLTFRI